MAVPINCSPETAVEITALPYSQTLNVTDAPEGLTNVSSCVTRAWNAVWYRYTVPDGVTFLYVNGDRGTGSDAAYDPDTSIWTGTPPTLTEFAIGSNTYCSDLNAGYFFRLPVTAGETYYFQVVNHDTVTGPDPSILEFNLQTPTNVEAPIGSIVISDDADEYPAAVLGATTGAYLQFKPFPAGEYTDTLPTGEICTQNGVNDDSIAFLDTDWNVVETVALGTRRLVAVKSDRSSAFYCVTRASAVRHVEKYTAIGVQVYDKTLPSDFDNTTVFALARDGSRIYASKTAANQPIWVYNLGTNTQESNLAVGVVGESFAGAGDGYTARDGTLLFLKNSSTDTFVVRYDQSTGAITNTYNPTTATYGQHFCIDSDTVGAESLLVWGYIRGDTNNNAYFERIRLSTGASLSEIGPISVTSSSYKSTDADQPDCISNSCPVFVLTAALAAPADPVPDYHTRTLVRRRLRRSPITWAEQNGLQARISVSLFAVDMQPATATADTPEPMVMVRASKDGGHTWTDWRQMSAGAVGAYTTRLNAWRWGSGRQWVFEVSVSDPVVWNLVQALMQAEPGNS